MSSESFYRTCDGHGQVPTSRSTKSVFAAFEVTVETNLVAVPDEIRNVIIKSLTEHTVEAVAQTYCGSSRLLERNFELSSILGEVSDFRELGSCLSTHRKSRSCSIYEGAISLAYTPLNQNLSRAELIDGALAAIKTSMNSTFLEAVNSSMDDLDDIVITEVSYAGSDSSSPTSPTIIAASEDGSFEDQSSSLNSLGIGMITLVGVLAAAIVVLLLACNISRNRSRGYKRRTHVFRGETKRSHNTDEVRSETGSVIQAQRYEHTIGKDGIPRSSKCLPTSDVEHSTTTCLLDFEASETEKNTRAYDRVVDIDSIEAGIPQDCPTNDRGMTNTMEPRSGLVPTFAPKPSSRRLHLCDSLETGTAKAKPPRRSLWACSKSEPPASLPKVEVVEHPHVDEEDESAQILMQKLDEIIANNVPTPTSVAFLRL